MREYQRIVEGIKEKGPGVRIPNTCRRALPRFFKGMGYKVGVEIGVQRSQFTRRLCRQGLTVYGVDPWMAYPDYAPHDRDQAHQDAIYANALKNISMFPKCTLIRKTSMEAVKDFEHDSIDFVYIDGHHGFKYVTEDIFEWSKRVRPGGCISGHDYAYSHHSDRAYILQVKYVIDAYTKAFNIQDWYVLGADKKTMENERRDQYRSWMWFKKG